MVLTLYYTGPVLQLFREAEIPKALEGLSNHKDAKVKAALKQVNSLFKKS